MIRSGARGGPVRTVGQALIVAAVSVGMAAYRFRVWRQSYSVPFMTAGSDDIQIAAIIRSIHDTGWYFTNPRIGAPFHQQLYDFPHAGESLQLLVIRFLTLFSVRPYWVMNVYFLLGFATLAFVTYLVLAHLRFRFGVAAVVALLYTWLPFHFMQGEFHLFRSTYLSAPIGVLLIFWILSWKDRFLVDPDGPVWGLRRLGRNLIWRRVLAAVALGVFVGAFETMTMAFVLVALVVSALVASVAQRDVGTLSAAVVGAVMIAATFGLLFLPNLAFKASHGPNTEAAARIPAEQIIYGLQISKMVFPVGDHHIGALAHLMPRSQERSPAPGEAGQNLGLLGSLGFLGLLYGVIAHRLDLRLGDDVADRKRLRVQSGLVALVLVLFATMSGFALVLSTLGLSQIRVWDRAVVVIAFCAYVVVAIALEHVTDWIHRRLGATPPTASGATSDRGAIGSGPGSGRASATRSRVLAGGASGVLLLAVTVFGLWDTDTKYASSRTNAAQNARAMQLTGVAAAIAARIGAHGKVFQLPVIPYPESPPSNAMQDYEELLPYLYSDGLSFSYGATRGRPDADWQSRVDNADPTPALAGLRGLGFDGVLVDTSGYADQGERVSAQLTAALGPPVVTSFDDRWRFWDLRDFAKDRHLDASDLRRAATALVGRDLMADLDHGG